MFGRDHSSSRGKCRCEYGHRCHCDHESPLSLPPHQREDLQSGRRSPYFGHEMQCFNWDNKCHCASSEPFRMPPEGHGSHLSQSEPPLTVRLNPQQVRDLYSSKWMPRHHHHHSHLTSTRHAALSSPSHLSSDSRSTQSRPPGHEGTTPVPPYVAPPAHTLPKDLPPSYESLFGPRSTNPEDSYTQTERWT